ncbi:MAG TPA: ABC transporter permease [Methanospirillum sp.]|uniref:ABC transporter permease n=1 Tax=Methanospirillum sp. TaxID=45200 RepID=UPI002CD1C025|nr:ABC transporter permease [Methanospirillum sp.]HWQ64020.1 ABC transporter permease [Methanospirillum sp.]
MDRSLLRYISRRALQIPFLLVGITILSFFIFYLSPIDPVVAYFGIETVNKMPVSDIALVKDELGLNKPIIIRYEAWFLRITHGDLGFSQIQHRPVLDTILEKFPATLLLTIPAYLGAMLCAIVFGLYATAKEGSLFDRTMTGVSYILYATPTFLVALLFMLIFAVWLGWLPASRMESVTAQSTILTMLIDRIRHLILPVTVLAMSHFTIFYGYIRSSLSDSMREDYITTARAKGLDEKTILYKHAFKNSLLPFITQVGLAIPYFIAGSVVVETIFAWPGIGRLTFEAAMRSDYMLLMGITLFTSIIVILGNLFADVAYAVVDPRVRYE